MSDSIEFVDLPPRTNASRLNSDPFWGALAENPGRWAKWPGSHKASANHLAAYHSKNGRIYEGAKRGGELYFRCVSNGSHG